jgi:hypothetical protein
MPRNTTEGCFYEFNRDQPFSEIGRSIPRPHALDRLRRGQDVYTPRDSDAKSLAKDVIKGKADWEGSHEPGFYPHYHPGGQHTCHVFYGQRSYRVGENRRS